MPRRTLVAAALALAYVACAVNPATGKKQLSLVGERDEVSMGRQYDKETMASLEPYGSPELQAYVQQLGQKLAATSERPGLEWKFRLVDDPAVNAFALPGGFVYVTRGLLTHLNSEAELASVLGHEIGHVTARHSVSQMSKQTLLGGLLGLGVALSPEVEQYAGVLTQGMGALFLKFSRDDERQADELGLRYIDRAGYDVRPMADVFETLGSVSRLEGGARLPDWQSTHPNPEDRRQRIGTQIAALHRSFEGRPVERESYLRRLDGMVFGANPRDGFVEGRTFFHPEMRFRFDAPEGWAIQNQTTSVVAASGARDAMIQLSVSAKAPPDAAAAAFFGRQGVEKGAVVARPIHELPAVTGEFRLATQQGALRGFAAFIAHEGKVFEMVGVAAEAKWPSHESAVREALGSFRRLTDEKILAMQPARIELVKVDRDTTLAELDRKRPSSIPLERLAVINHVEKNGTLLAGRTYKRVVGGK